MERDDRAPVATFYFADRAQERGVAVTLGESSAHHARVKRLVANDPVRLTDGLGHMAAGRIAAAKRSTLEIEIDRTWAIPRPPAIHVLAPIGDRERMLWLAEKATELGVASWQPVRFARSASVTPRGEGSAFAAKVRLRMISALEQSGGAWLPELRPETTVERIAQDDRVLRLLLDAGGAPLLTLFPIGARREVAVLFGPEGGVEPAELKSLLSGGWRAAKLGSTTLRFETAGLAAIAVLRAASLEEG